MIRQRLPHTHRALATAFALMMVGLVTVSFTATALLLRNEVRRARGSESDAQIRQLLLAGVADAVAHARTWGEAMPLSTQWGLTVPHDPRLTGGSVTIESSPGPSGLVNLHIAATLDGHTADEALQFRRAGEHWDLVETQLGAFFTNESAAKHPAKKIAL